MEMKFSKICVQAGLCVTTLVDPSGPVVNSEHQEKYNRTFIHRHAQVRTRDSSLQFSVSTKLINLSVGSHCRSLSALVCGSCQCRVHRVLSATFACELVFNKCCCGLGLSSAWPRRTLERKPGSWQGAMGYVGARPRNTLLPRFVVKV